MLNMDHSRQSLSHPDLYNRHNTHSSRIGERRFSGIIPSPRSDDLAWNSMTETALRWFELLDASSIACAEYYSLRQKEIECPQLHSIGNNAAETTQNGHHWEYSGRWFTIAVGGQKRPISRTNTPDSQIGSPVASDPSSINSNIFEETKQQSLVDTLELSLISKQKHGFRRESNALKLFRERTKQKLRFRSTEKFRHLTRGEDCDSETLSFLKRTKTILRKLVIPQKSCGNAVDSITSITVTAQQNDSYDYCSSSQGSYRSANSSYEIDLSAPGSLGSPPPQLKTQRAKTSVDVRSSTSSSGPVWFRLRVEGIEDPSSRDEFDQNIPDHLPSSPLCPRHHKHPSGGTEDCIMHGRNRKEDMSA